MSGYALRTLATTVTTRQLILKAPISTNDEVSVKTPRC